MSKSILSVVKDGWRNLLTGMGTTAKDRRFGAEVEWQRLIEMDAEHLYAADDMAGKVVNLIPETAFQKGVEIVATDSVDKDSADEIHDYFEQREVFDQVLKAWKWERCYGGAGIFPSIDDGQDLAEPLDETRIKSIATINVLHRWELFYQSIQSDILKPGFGLPDVYKVIPRGGIGNPHLVIHASRLIRLGGTTLPRILFIQNVYWGDSVLNRFYNVLRNFNLAHDSVASMIEDFNQAVMKLKDLADILQSEGGEAKIKQRIEIMNLSRSVLNTILIDADQEEFEQKARPVTGLSDLMQIINKRMVAATGIPATVLLGESPTGGLSGKGESENRDWYDLVANQREVHARPPLDRLMRLCLMDPNSPTGGKVPDDFTWKFSPLWQMDETETATMRKTVAETDAIYLDRSVVSPSDIGESRFGGNKYSIETQVDLSLIPTMEDQQKAEEEANAAQHEQAKELLAAKGEPSKPEEK